MTILGRIARFVVGPSLMVGAWTIGCTGDSTVGSTHSTYDLGWRLVEDLRLTETAEGDFVGLSRVVADSAKNIYVLDGLDPRVHAFGPDGRQLWSIGREGDGPGELSIYGKTMAIAPDNTLWIGDEWLRRLSVFDVADGSLLNTHQFPWAGRLQFGRPFGPEGKYTGWILRYPLEDSHGSLEIAEYHPVTVDFDSGHIDTLPPVVEDGGRKLGEPRSPFAPHTVIALDGLGSIWLSDKREYRLYKRTFPGDTTLSVGLDENPVAVDEEDAVSYRRRLSRSPWPPSEVDRWVAALDETKTKPMIRNILSDGHGHIYVFPRTLSAPEGTAIDVFRHTGEYLGRMDVPEEAASANGFATFDHIYLILSPRDDPTIVRLRIDRNP